MAPSYVCSLLCSRDGTLLGSAATGDGHRCRLVGGQQRAVLLALRPAVDFARPHHWQRVAQGPGLCVPAMK